MYKVKDWIDYNVGDCIDYGTVIRHCGNPNSSQRVGWVGVVAECWDQEEESSDRIFVEWRHNSRGDIFTVPVTQSYSVKWFLTNVKHKGESGMDIENGEGITNRTNWLTQYCIASFITNPRYHKNIKTQIVPEVGILVAKVSDVDGFSGQLGVICEVTDYGKVSVRWILDNNAKLLEAPYNRHYVNSGLLHNEICGYYTGEYILKYDKRGERIDIEHQCKKAVKSYKSGGRYLVWSPAGNTNPVKVHNGLAEATRVAAFMSEKHNQDFYACKLTSRSFQQHSRTTLVEDLQ